MAAGLSDALNELYCFNK